MVSVPFMPFLRPLALPRPTTVHRLLRFSTSATCRKEVTSTAEDPNLVASRTADVSYPPASMRSNPRPKVSKSSRRASLPTKQRPYPTRGASHHQPVVVPLVPAAVTPLEPNLCAPNLPYFVNRTQNNELPVYHVKKRAGSMLLTQVRKIDGSVEKLRVELQKALGLNAAEVTINPVTQHIMLKGFHRDQIKQYLWQRKF